MNKIKRYNIDIWFDESNWAYSSDVEEKECEQGEYCKYEDVKDLIKENKRLKKENKLLREELTDLSEDQLDRDNY